MSFISGYYIGKCRYKTFSSLQEVLLYSIGTDKKKNREWEEKEEKWNMEGWESDSDVGHRREREWEGFRVR